MLKVIVSKEVSPRSTLLALDAFLRSKIEGNMDLDLKPDHIGGGFEWEKEPLCTCGKLKDAVAEGFIFVSNFNENGSNVFYMMLVNADGELVRSKGVPISFCPWCGDKIFGHKLYPDQAKKD